MFKEVAKEVFFFEDTCHVYILREGNKAILIDYGSGEVLKYLHEIGVEQVTDIMITHHHRDQAQGLNMVKKSVRIWVPHTEYDLFAHVNEHWQAREIVNNYNVRQDRFSILQSVQIHGTLEDYSQHKFGSFTIEVIPTPGHTVGSVTILVNGHGNSLAFTGDLISHPGKVWSLAATQWTYNGAEGIVASILSLLDLQSRNPNLLLPSHGDLMNEPTQAMNSLIENLQELLHLRNQYKNLSELYEQPFEQITEHVLWNKTCFANSYVILSDSGKALIIDYGYDFNVGMASGYDRSSRRPWLYNIDKLKKAYGVTKIDVVMPTHYHDDHVAGFNLLREVEGTSVWAAEHFSDLLENPDYYDLPCIWYDPIKVDRKLPLNQSITWEEYEFTLHEQPGHTLYAVAINFRADNKHFLAIGDQQENDGHIWNYIYKNKFQMDDYKKSGDLYLAINPDIILSGHWSPLKVEPEYLEMLKEKGSELERLHHCLLPLDVINLGAEGFCAWINPYQLSGSPGDKIDVQVKVLNPFHSKEKAVIKLVLPEHWKMAIEEKSAVIFPLQYALFTFSLHIPQQQSRRERIAADVAMGGHKLGQQAEALLTIEEPRVIG